MFKKLIQKVNLSVREVKSWKQIASHLDTVANKKSKVIEEFAGYKKNKQGQTVMSKLDEQLLIKISNSTAGKYYRAEKGIIPVSRLVHELKGLDKEKLSSNMSRQYEDRFQYLIAAGLLLLLLDVFISERKNLLFSKWSLFKNR